MPLYRGRFQSVASWQNLPGLIKAEPLVTVHDGLFTLPGTDPHSYNEMTDDYIAAQSLADGTLQSQWYMRTPPLIYNSGIGTPRFEGPTYKQWPASVTTPTNATTFVDGSQGNVY
jgi:hypothetical protein